jgi:hypothetical protein
MDSYLLAAKRLDAWRVVPRLVLLFYCAFFAKAWFFIVDWFIAYDWSSLPKDQIIGAAAVAAVAGFPAIILGILTKVFFQILELYQKTYRPPEEYDES